MWLMQLFRVLFYEDYILLSKIQQGICIRVT